jgi:(S)-sulfolactate dehydrogenase
MADARPRIVISEALNASRAALGDGVDVVERADLWSRRPDLMAELQQAAGLVVRNQTQVDAELLAAAPHLRVVGRLGAGLDNIDVPLLREGGVELVHGGGLNARAVAEYALGAALTLARRLAASDRDVRAGRWDRYVGEELGGDRMGVVGLGATGAELCRLARALGMDVIGHDPYLEPPEGVRAATLDEVLRTSLVVSVHVPLLESTRNLIGAPQLASMRPGAILINASRGGIVDEVALAAALRQGRPGGAALDVRPQEPPAPDDPLRTLDNVLLTPHLAGLSRQSQDAIAKHVLTGVRRAVTG